MISANATAPRLAPVMPRSMATPPMLGTALLAAVAAPTGVVETPLGSILGRLGLG
ncbi:MAG: hypothetical protein O3A31_12785 [Planctomycetota bacterium]|nr:hypothetical protein [Planctomycetota bacterium]